MEGMTRSYRVLALALVSIAVLLGLAKLIGRSSDTAASAAASSVAPSSTASSGSSTTGVAPADSTRSTAATNTSVTARVSADPGTSAPPVVNGITDADCPSSAHGAVLDRNNQRGALCDHGAVTYRFPVTSARRQPDPGTYPVYARDMHTSSMFGGHYSTMTHFVAFARGKYTNARIAFHSVPVLADGTFVQPLSSVGSSDQWGNTSGCIHVIPTDAVKVWNWLAIGDKVHVIS
jgi:lipoprotein-anchoring transpeptidase ErfK/SrfK